MPIKLTLKEVKKKSRDLGFEFLDDSYINNDYIHTFKCIKDNMVYPNTFKSICDGYGLKCCGKRKRIESQTYTLNEAISISKNNGFIFLDDNYIGCRFKHNFKCIEHNAIHKSRFESIVAGRGLRCCMIASNIRNSNINKAIFVGKNHGSWNPNLTDEERRIKRSILGYAKWRSEVVKGDDYKCRVCDSNNVLHAHHLQSYKLNKKLRLNLNNGITLCRECHNLLHSIYGKGNTTLNQIKILSLYCD